MAETEFIIGLTEHRIFGNILYPYLIKPKGPYYSVECLVKIRDLNSYDYQFSPVEKLLVKLLDGYSDERLTRKFSRGKGFTQFFKEMDPGFIQDQVVPYIEKIVVNCVHILMKDNIRVFRKAVQYTNLYEEDIVKISRNYAEPVFYFDRKQDETRYELKIFQDGAEFKLLDRHFAVVNQEPGIIFHQNQLYVFQELSAKKLIPFQKKSCITIPKSSEEKYFSTYVLHTIRDFNVMAQGFKIMEGTSIPKAWLILENNLRMEPVLSLQFEYDDEVFLPNSIRKTAVSFVIRGEEYVFRKVRREFDWEAGIIQFLDEIGLIEQQGFYVPKGVNYLSPESALYEIVNWISSRKKELDGRSVGIRQGRLPKNYFTGEQNLKVEIKSSHDWFDVYVIVTFGEYRIPFIKLKDLILNRIREFELPNGEMAILPGEWFARFSNLFPHAKITGDRLQIRKHHYMLLQAQVADSPRPILKDLPVDGLPFEMPTSLPSNLKAELRSYQKIGFLWLFQLHQHNFGGCLADDMGLGKTLQTLTFLLKLKKLRKVPSGSENSIRSGQLSLFDETATEENYQPASMIVVPTSLVHNWINEIRKFTPSLKVYQHTGSGRSRESDLSGSTQSYDIILTTYGTVRNDSEILSKTEFFYLILDESQYVKNPDSKTYKAVMKINARNRLVLTGTPIENSLADLWSQMNFLNKGLLGSFPFFRQYFLGPVEKNNDPEKQELLRKMIRPFILRRTKEEVARDLPPLMEQVRYCTMTPDQQVIYEHEKSVIRNTILASIERKGIERSSFVLLQGLTRLRQLANHPSMVTDDEEVDSGKFSEVFLELGNLMAENHKVLIFSSFVKHLDLLKTGIEEKGWKYSMLTGKTEKRETVIRQFQDDPLNRIFLISLKAGGVGLNLTGADYVFIVDPWWNPASENQAVSRSHRIGQDKHVFVYRFITKNSIEEKIQQLKERKLALADRFINSNNPFHAATREDILDLLE